MKTILFAACLLLTRFGYSHHDSTRKVMFSIGIQGSPDYCYRKLDFYGKYVDYWDKMVVDGKEKTESEIIGYTAGVGLKAVFFRRLIVETGAYLTKKGYQAKWQSRYDFAHLYIVGGFLEPYFEYSYYKYFNFIEVPLKIGFTIIDKRTKLYAISGLAGEFLVAAEQTNFKRYTNGFQPRMTSRDRKEFAKSNIALQCGMGVSFDITNHFLVSFEPTYTRFINSILEYRYGRQEYLYSFNARLGVSYRF